MVDGSILVGGRMSVRDGTASERMYWVGGWRRCSFELGEYGRHLHVQALLQAMLSPITPITEVVQKESSGDRQRRTVRRVHSSARTSDNSIDKVSRKRANDLHPKTSNIRHYKQESAVE